MIRPSLSAKKPVPIDAFAAEPVSTTSTFTTCSEYCLKISGVVARADCASTIRPAGASNGKTTISAVNKALNMDRRTFLGIRLGGDTGNHLVLQRRRIGPGDEGRAYDDGDIVEDFDRHEFLSALIFHGSCPLATQ